MPEEKPSLSEGVTLVKQGASFELQAAQAFGRYRIVQTLAQGGMGAVYLAFDPVLNRQVAIKTPLFTDDANVALARFLRETRVVASMQHPHICPVYDMGEIGNVPFLCMPFITGKPLSHYLIPDVPADPRWSARLVHRVAQAMDYVHGKGIVHRDLKPPNIMIDEREEPVVMDFGLARLADVGQIHLTAQGDVMGTPSYMPPEQVSGELNQIGPASDIYSLGCIMFVLLTGKKPFQGDSLTVMMRIAMDPPPVPSKVNTALDPRWDAICLKAMEKAPANRWPSMKAFAAVIEPMLSATPDASPSARPRARVIPKLTLRVMGTSLAYRPPPTIEVISVGRQKRKPGESVSQGNDFVLRIAGNDVLTSRISRRHFEIHSDGQGGYSLVDLSKLGVRLNGQPVVKEQKVALTHGDELDVAGVVKLGVMVEDAAEWQLVRTGAVAEVPSPAIATPNEKLILEASLGDMCTIGEAAP